jgi:putative zinc finger protein
MAVHKKDGKSCDDIIHLISRNLDGDLNRKETLRLHDHLASCAQCRTQLSQISALGGTMDDLRRLYQNVSPSDQLKKTVHDAVSKKKKYHTSNGSFFLFFQKLRQKKFFPTAMIPAFASLGLAFAISLNLLLWQQGVFDPTAIPERLVVHEIPLRSAEDMLDWNQHHTILPSQKVHLNVQESHRDPYYFQVSSSKPVYFSVSHNKKTQNSKELQKYHLNGIQYFTLKSPRFQDVIQIHNQGDYPISLKTSSFKPQAIQVNFK